jgi:microcystin-dependent protein
MATSFPSGLDALTNPTSGNTLASPDHAGQHADANDAIEALEAKVGVNSSAVTTSHDYLIKNNTPAGVINMWATTTAPTSWLLCDGTAVSRTTYAALFAVISTTYGVGDGSTTFNVPNLKGKVPVGRDSADVSFDSMGETGGAKTHTLTSAEMPVHTHTQDSHNHTQNAHTHTITDPGHIHSFNQWTLFYSTAFVSAANTSTNTGSFPSTPNVNSNTTGITVNNQTPTNIATTATNQNAGSGSAHNNLQPYIVLNYIIKT